MEFSYKKYWNDRYKNGGNSGAGSYGENAFFKAKIINKIIRDDNIKTVFELGCGDGNNLALYTGYDSYVGYDISETAMEICKEKFKNDETKSFIKKIDSNKYDLILCLDVLFHIMDRKEWENTIDTLINKGKHILFYTFLEHKGSEKHINNFQILEYLDKKHPKIQYGLFAKTPPSSKSRFIYIKN